MNNWPIVLYLVYMSISRKGSEESCYFKFSQTSLNFITRALNLLGFFSLISDTNSIDLY